MILLCTRYRPPPPSSTRRDSLIWIWIREKGPPAIVDVSEQSCRLGICGGYALEESLPLVCILQIPEEP